MDNHDKIFEKIKNAALNEQPEDFLSMDKVWSRVESKLDHKVLKKENKLWKKIAIAASLLLVFTMAYQVFKPAKEIIIPQNETVGIDTLKITSPIITNQSEAVANTDEPNPAIKKEANKILEKQIKNSIETVAATNVTTATPDAELSVGSVTEENRALIEKDTDAENRTSGSFKKGKAFEARSVHRNLEVAGEHESKEAAAASAVKSPPLVVIDGKAVTGKNADRQLKEGLSGLDANSADDIVILKEPLYIINGSYYSEQELFGPNPTSPYHPLNQQEIETLSILQGEKAIAAYGKKGEKGVVIISTKNGKPVKASARKER
jgi:hypothetical protein